MPRREQYQRHAEKFGVALVFETAAGLGRPDADLTVGELVDLARRLKVIDPTFTPGRLDPLVKLADAEVKLAYLRRIAPVLDALATPLSQSGRCGEVCGGPISGRADRRTCSNRCREALRRGGGVGPFSRPEATFTGRSDPRVGPRESVTLTPLCKADSRRRNRGSGTSREVGVLA
jgi:hypothetical protein